MTATNKYLFLLMIFLLACDGDPTVNLDAHGLGTLPAESSAVGIPVPVATIAVPRIPIGPVPLAPTMTPSDGPGDGGDDTTHEDDNDGCDHHDKKDKHNHSHDKKDKHNHSHSKYWEKL